MQTPPHIAQPTDPVPPGGPPPGNINPALQGYGPQRPGGAPPDRGLAQLVVTSLLVVLAFSAGWFGNGYVNRNSYVPNDQQHKYQYVMNQAWNAINDNFVFTQNIDQQKMAYAAIDAMVQTLNDPGHTRFETPEEFQNETNQLNDQGIVGIGVELSGGGKDPATGAAIPITITAVFPNTPASRGGLQAGDQIVAVNGTDVRGFTLDQVSALIKGPEGTDVTLTIIRPSVSPTARRAITLTRAKFTAPTVISFIIPELNIADIQLIDFSQNADSQLRDALKAATAAHVAGAILDLRGNGGGLLNQAVAVTSEFVPAGPNKNVMVLRSRTDTQKLAVTQGGVATSLPLAILINHDTASAAEITAGAIALNRPEVRTVGQTTYGTGTVLEPFSLADGSVLDLGTSEWLLPDGTSVYHRGLDPEQRVSLPATLQPLTALSAPDNKATFAYIQQYGDPQLLQAIQDVQQQAANKPAA